MNVSLFDVFTGRYPDQGVFWLESAEGLPAAVERMKVHAAEKPGPYFVIRLSSHEVLASIDTTHEPQSRARDLGAH